MDTLDGWLSDTEDDKLAFYDEEELGVDFSTIDDMPAKRLQSSVMSVFHRLGGDAFLYNWAQANPTAFVTKFLVVVLKHSLERVPMETTQALKDIETEQELFDELKRLNIPLPDHYC